MSPRSALEASTTHGYNRLVNRAEIVGYFEAIDRALRTPAVLYIYGSASCILLGEPDRTSLDIDVAGPYSLADYADLRQAAEAAGIPIDPKEDFQGDHIEWTDIALWRGGKE